MVASKGVNLRTDSLNKILFESRNSYMETFKDQKMISKTEFTLIVKISRMILPVLYGDLIIAEHFFL